MDKDRVQRMLALGRKKQSVSLSEKETEELNALRHDYLKDFRAGFSQQLDQVYVKQDDGSYRKLQKKRDAGTTEGDCS